jgi:hypothetical protein
LVRGGAICVGGKAGDKRRRMAESHAPPLQILQIFEYLRDHLLLGKNADIHGDYKSTFGGLVNGISLPLGVSGNI